jgi:hypothetical protein
MLYNEFKQNILALLVRQGPPKKTQKKNCEED